MNRVRLWMKHAICGVSVSDLHSILLARPMSLVGVALLLAHISQLLNSSYIHRSGPGSVLRRPSISSVMSVASTLHNPIIPLWQPDETVSCCPLCQRKFTWFQRKHHCRKCGRVVCNICSGNFSLLPITQVVRQLQDASSTFLGRLAAEVEHERCRLLDSAEVRICDACFSVVEQDRCRRMLGLDLPSSEARATSAQVIREPAVIASSGLHSPPPSYSRAPKTVPVNTTTRVLEHEANRSRRSSAGHHVGSHGHRQSRRSRHGSEHEASASLPLRSGILPPAGLLTDVVPLRYVSFELNEQDKMIGDECPICFEEYEPSQHIARLECWCVFHVKCIKAWKSQKAGTGGCPLHFHDP